MNIRKILEARVMDALAAAGAPEGSPGIVMPSAKFGDYQANGVMAAAKKLKTNPREFAATVVEHLDLLDMAQTPEIAGPGFINITLTPEFLATTLNASRDEHLGVDRAEHPQCVVIDYSHPNLAKEMHVGHLRSTIIGDALARVLGFLGHNVKRQNHVGDWGTQFGMLLVHLEELLQQGHADPSADLADLEEFYRESKRRFDSDPEFANAAREAVVKFQGGDACCLERWKQFLDISMSHCQQVYDALGVLLVPEDIHGESAYNDDLPKVIEDLKAKSLLAESQGAQCVFPEGFTDKEGNPQPMIVQKSDGGYLYATTDLAAIRYRIGELKGDRLLYVVDARQTLHFRQLFAVAREAGFADESVILEHAPFGMMLGDDHKPFKTREGGTIKLTDLLDEATEKAYAFVSEKNPDLPEADRREIARVVGIGAVKYTDLSQHRTSDYVFAWDKMLSLDGNTAPYLQYAYARIRSIFRKAELTDGAIAELSVAIEAEQERELAVKLLQFNEMLDVVAVDSTPHQLCAYLYELSGAFMSFYEACPVLKAEGATREGRLALCAMTARTMSAGLGLLGIGTLEQM
jgi:arginyl-tRNA synthetase